MGIIEKMGRNKYENGSVQTKIESNKDKSGWDRMYQRISKTIEHIKNNFFKGSEGNIKKILNDKMKIINSGEFLENAKTEDKERKEYVDLNKTFFKYKGIYKNILKEIQSIEEIFGSTNTESIKNTKKEKKIKLKKDIEKLFEHVFNSINTENIKNTNKKNKTPKKNIKKLLETRLPLRFSKFLEIKKEEKYTEILKYIKKLNKNKSIRDYLSESWEKDRECDLAEFITSMVFNKFFEGHYVAVNTNDFDNFENKTDILLIPSLKELPHLRIDTTIMSEEEFFKKGQRAVKYNSYDSKIEYGASFDGYEPDGQKKYKIENIIGAPLIISYFMRTLVRRYMKAFNAKNKPEVENIEKEILIIFYKNTKEQLQRLENVKIETNKDLKECKKELSNLKLEPIIQITLSGEKSMTPKNEKIKEKRFEIEEEIKNLNDTIKILDKNIEKMGVFVKYIEDVLKNNKIEID